MASKKSRKPIGPVKAGGFHEWLGKKRSAPITQADIKKGLAAGGEPARMANFARNSKHWNHPGKRRKAANDWAEGRISAAERDRRSA